MRTEDLLFSVADKCINGFCLAKCLRVKISVFIQNLCMTDHDLLSLFPFHMQLDNTCDDLSEINQSFTLWCHDQLFAGNFLCDTDRLIFLCSQNCFVKLFDNNVSFCDLRCICVDGLSHIDFAVTDLSCLYRPCFIGSDHILTSIFIFNMKLCKCSHLCAILIWHTIEAKDSFIPAISNCDLNFVFCIKQFCHIIDLILKTVVIACPARCHTVVSYSLSVQGRLIYAMCCCIQTGFLYLFIQCKCLSKYRAGSLLFREITCDHLCFKFCIVKNSCLKRTFNRFCISVIVCNRYLHSIHRF